MHTPLAVSAALEVPYFQDDATCLFFLDLLHRLLAGHQIAAQPTGPLEVTTYTGLIRLARVKTPSLPIIVDEDGDGSEPGAVFFDNILSYASDAERTRAYDESRRALDRVLALRNHELLGSFREYLKEVRNDVDAHAAEADYAASVAIEHQKRLDEVNAAIGREFHGFTRFATTASYVSLATGLPGLINPVIGAVSLGAAVAATTADVVKKRKIERMKRNPRFYQENRRYNWHAYYLELARAYEES